MVQSEQEKLLLKQARKEEKKFNKLLAKEEELEEDDECFDPVELRMKRLGQCIHQQNISCIFFWYT